MKQAAQVKKPVDDELEMLTPEQLAELLHVKRRQLERFGIPACHFGRKTIRYSRAVVAEWLKSQQRKSA